MRATDTEPSLWFPRWIKWWPGCHVDCKAWWEIRSDLGRTVVRTPRRWNRLSKRRMTPSLALESGSFLGNRRNCVATARPNCPLSESRFLSQTCSVGTQNRRGLALHWEGREPMSPSDLSRVVCSGSYRFFRCWIHMCTYSYPVQMCDRHPCATANAMTSHLEAKEPWKSFSSYFWGGGGEITRLKKWNKWLVKVISSAPGWGSEQL